MKEYISAIKQEEIEFPKFFASYVEKEYGIIFYMENNKDSYDGNHACIYPHKITDLGAVLDDIKEFYQKLGNPADVLGLYIIQHISEMEFPRLQGELPRVQL